jgi:hypothetical protein
VHTLPKMQIHTNAPLSQARRLALFRMVLTDETAPLRSRVAATLVLLYTQPLTRIERITLDDVIRDGGQLHLRLGEPPSPVPAPVADLIERHIVGAATCAPRRTPTRLALPQPLRPEYLSELLQAIGIPTSAVRGAALRQHIYPRELHEIQQAQRAAQGTNSWRADYQRRAGIDGTMNQAAYTIGCESPIPRPEESRARTLHGRHRDQPHTPRRLLTDQPIDRGHTGRLLRLHAALTN